MPTKVSAIQTKSSDLPETWEMKTQQLYTSHARERESVIKQRVGADMLLRGPPMLSIQEQKTDKPIPKIELNDKMPAKEIGGTSLFLTRKKVNELSSDPKPKDTKGMSTLSTRTATPNGVMSNKGGNTPPTSHVRSQPAVYQKAPEKGVTRLSKQSKVTAQKPQGPSRRPTTILEAEREANRLIREGNGFSKMGVNTMRY